MVNDRTLSYPMSSSRVHPSRHNIEQICAQTSRLLVAIFSHVPLWSFSRRVYRLQASTATFQGFSKFGSSLVAGQGSRLITAPRSCSMPIFDQVSL